MANKWKCPYCPDEPAMNKDDLIDHIDQHHREMIPEGWTASRLAFKIVRHKDHGTCVVCKDETEWNEKRGKYQRLCNNPQCRKALREEALKNHIRIYKVPTLLNDMEHQDKMLKGRHISGEYTFRDGGKISYVGSFEKKFLEFMDTVLECDSKDIMEPGPVLEYNYNGKSHKWITDFLYIPYNLIIEVKDGGDNPNKKTMEDTRAREKSKDKLMTNMGTYNYLKLTNNNFRQLMSIFADLKQQMIDDTGENKRAIIRINEDFSFNIIGNYVDNIKDAISKNVKMKDILNKPDLDKTINAITKRAREIGIEVGPYLSIYVFLVYTAPIEYYVSLIFKAFEIPTEIIATAAKFIADKVRGKKSKPNICPIRDFNTNKYKLICFNTHIVNGLVGSAMIAGIAAAIDKIRDDSITGDGFLADFFLYAKICALFMYIDQWDARDLLLIPNGGIDDNAGGFGSNNETKKATMDLDVVAVNDGVVVCTSNQKWRDDKLKSAFFGPLTHAAGNHIIIMHDPGNFSLYGHLQTDTLRVEAGDIVKQGDIIGKVGNTGNSTEPHLHFQMNFTAPVVPLLNFGRALSNFKFKSVDLPLTKMITGDDKLEKLYLKKFTDKEYKNKTGLIPQFCFIKPA